MSSVNGQRSHDAKKVHCSTEEKKMDEELQNQLSEPEMNWLPLEIWDMILRKIDDPQQVLFCCDVCYDWNLLLQHKMASAYHQLLLPKLIPYLDKKDILNCSAVSKDWNAWIDTSVINFRKNNIVWCHESYGRLPILRIDDNDDAIETEKIYAEKHEYVGNEFDNTLVYRHVIMILESCDNMDDAEFEAYCHNLEIFFQRFGKYLHQLELVSNVYGLVRMTRMLYILLSNTPYLEAFKCEFETDEYDEEDDDEFDAYIAESPLPSSTMQKLEIMGAPNKIIEELTKRYGSQIMLLYVDEILQINFQNLIVDGDTFQNVKYFRCHYNGSRWDIEDLVRFWSFLENLNWPLTEMVVKFYGSEEYCELFRRFFTTLSKEFCNEYAPMPSPCAQTMRVICATEKRLT